MGSVLAKRSQIPGKGYDKEDVMDMVLNVTTPLITEAKKYSTKLKDFAKFHTLVEAIGNQPDPFPANEPSRLEAIPAFIEWCKLNGIFHKGLEIEESPEAGMGLRTTENIKAHDLVISVPYIAMLSSDQAFEEFGSLIDAASINRCWMQVPVALKLVNERILGNASPWKPYIDILPKGLPHPIYFAPLDFGYLGGSPAYEDGMNLFYEISAQYGLIYREICRRYQGGTFDGILDPFNFTYEAYRWAMGLALTRSLKVTKDDGENVATVLVPYWDMCNNGVEALYTRVDMKCTESSKPRLHAFASRDLQTGEEMYICYRDTTTPNEYFTIWGLAKVSYFSPIGVKISALDRNYSAKYQLLETLQEKYSPIELKITRDTIPLSTPDLQALLIICATTADLGSGALSTETWKRAWQHLEKRIRRRLDMYNYKASHYIKEPHHTEQTVLAIGQVCAEKAVLEKALESVITLNQMEPQNVGVVNFLQKLQTEESPSTASPEATSANVTQVDPQPVPVKAA